MMETYNQDPNFSIVMPGGCNAECPFCFNNNKTKPKSCSEIKFIIGLWERLRLLSKQFYQISITGNEPMLSPYINGVMEVCKEAKNEYTNILLTTNGTNLLKNPQRIIDGVHHINISRHHYDEKKNKDIFRGTYNITNAELTEIIDVYSRQGIDVSLNCVINNNTTQDFINFYIDFAKIIGANAVRFRKENGVIKPTPVESLFAENYPILWHGSCPVCRTDLRIIRGMKTYWKSSVLEPSEHITDTIYELVYDVDGKTYLDWNMKKPLADDNEICEYDKDDIRTYKSTNTCGNEVYRTYRC